MNFQDQIKEALKAAPPLGSLQRRQIFGCCRKLTDKQVRVRIKHFILKYPQYRSFLEPVVNAWTETG